MIKILHLYYDLLNLYGEQGNILGLVDSFKKQNVDVKVDFKSIGDDLSLDDYDIVYLGSGSLEGFKIALNDIVKYKKEFKKYIDSNKYLIATGNSYLLFGKYVEIDKEKYNTLGLFEYYAKSSDKCASECFMKLRGSDNIIIGFENRSFIVNNKDNHLFEVISGISDNPKSNNEGFRYKNFIGTFVFGPLLIRNPFLTDNIVKNVLENNKKEYTHIDDTPLYKAYNEYIKNFYDKA